MNPALIRKHCFLTVLVVIVACIAPVAHAVRPPAEGDMLKTLRPGHPRLYILDQDLAAIRTAIEKDPLVAGWHRRLDGEARKMLQEPVVEHKLIGPRLLSQSKAALRRISTLAGLHRLKPDAAKVERARKEMLTAAAFADWNPSHFLDTAEMTNALAIGYDWLFDVLSAEDCATIRNAIIEKGLKPGLAAFAKNEWWTRTHNNWSQVCNGGLTAGALAIADEAPDVARAVINHGRESIRIPMRMFAPDGGCEEGPGYWNYATSYNSFYLSALQSALGTDFGLTGMEGFANTGMFRIHSIGPTGLTYNYADAREGAGTAPQMLWMARQFNQPLYAEHERRVAVARPTIFHLLWAGAAPQPSNVSEPPLDAFFRNVDVAFFRSSWSDANAVYVGFKGGYNKASHSHLDLGSFVLDAMGERWAIDLGPDDYNLPAYFGRLRWTYYRLRTESHNTLTIDGENQDPSARTPIVNFKSSPARAFAVVDMTPAYKPKLKRAMRGIALIERQQVLVQDEVDAEEPVDVVWNFLTRAKIQVLDKLATLSSGTAKLQVQLIEPLDAKFVVSPASAAPPQAQQPDVNNLSVRLPGRVTKTRIVVLLEPGGDEGASGRSKVSGAKAIKVEPLENWDK